MSVWMLQCRYEISDASHAAYTKSLKARLAPDSRSGRHGKSASAVIRIRARTLCGYFSKHVTVIQKGNIKLLRFEVKDGKRPLGPLRWPLFTDHTRGAYRLGKPGSPNRRQIVVHSRRMFLPLICLSATTMRMTEEDRHYIHPTRSRDAFADALSSILTRAAPIA
jgi:hypothetical protein